MRGDNCNSTCYLRRASFICEINEKYEEEPVYLSVPTVLEISFSGEAFLCLVHGRRYLEHDHLVMYQIFKDNISECYTVSALNRKQQKNLLGA